MKAAREINPKNDSKRSNFQEREIIMQLWVTRFIENWSTVDDEF